uniref:cGMP-dependent protein kinase n=1 Tax=Zooxanthella nutricula TaxID=1333877 RepID=A0A7S2M933_9DINO
MAQVDLNDAEKLQLLQGVPMFSVLERDEMELLASACEVVTFLEGEEAMRSGESSQGMHVLASGSAKRLISHEVGVLSAGDSIGDCEMLKGMPFQETVEAFGGPMTTLHVEALAFRAMGFHKKVNALQKKKGLKRRDASLTAAGRRASSAGYSSIAFLDDDFAMIADAISCNQNIREVLNLTPEQISYCAREAYRKEFAADENVFDKGDNGHRFYIVISGLFEVRNSDIVTTAGTSGTGVILRPSDTFGELALLYNAPRSATVTCVRAGAVWVLSRTTFRNCKQKQMQGRILEYSELIRTVDVFEQRGAQMSSICNALEERAFVRGEMPVQQGMPMDCFYVVFEGMCQSIRDGKVEGELVKGAFLGEQSLLREEVAPVSLRVASDKCTILRLDRASFSAVLHSESDMSLRLPLARLSSVSRELHRGDLQRQGVLGAGSFGMVTLERHAPSQALYALKAISKDHIIRDNLKGMVLNEKLCQGLLDSDFVVRLVATYRDDAHVYLLLEPCFGGELFDAFQERELFGKEAHAKFYAACAALGLEHMHSRRIIYRDLKLENCLLTLTGYLKLTDFGISKVCVGKTYTMCGTADYFAPEMLRQTGHNRGVDWWALGVMLYMMMTGRAPFEAFDTMRVYRKIIKGFAKVTFPDDLPEHCVGMIRGLCQRNPEDRLTMGSLGIQNYKDHPWYRTFGWQSLEAFCLQAPYVPELTEEAIVQKAQMRDVEPFPEVPMPTPEGDGLVDEDVSWDESFDMDLFA